MKMIKNDLFGSFWGFLGIPRGANVFKTLNNTSSNIFTNLFCIFFRKKYFVKNIFGKNIFSKIFFCAYFCNFFSAKCLIIISYSLPQLTLPKNITFRGFQRGGHNVPPPPQLNVRLGPPKYQGYYYYISDYVILNPNTQGVLGPHLTQGGGAHWAPPSKIT